MKEARLAELHAAILASPDDDDLRLVYADALAEAGDEAHAELIGVHLALAKDPTPELRARFAALEAAHGARIAGPIAHHARTWRFERGLVSRIEVDLITLARHADVLLANTAVDDIHLLSIAPGEQEPAEDPREEELRAAARVLAASPYLTRIRSLSSGEDAFGRRYAEKHEVFVPLMDGAWPRLRELLIGDAGSPAMARAIAAAHERLPALTHLGFVAWTSDGHDLDDDGAEALAASPLLARLEILELEGAGLGHRGVVALARAVRGLRRLNLTGIWYYRNFAGVDGALALAAAEGLDRLEELALAGCEIADSGLAAIAAAPWLASVRELDITDNALTDAGLLALAHSPHARSLERIRVSEGSVGFVGSRNQITAAGLHALEALPRLRELGVGLEDEDQEWLPVPLPDLSERFPSE